MVSLIKLFLIGRLPVVTQHPMNMIINLTNHTTNVSLTCEADGASSYNWKRQNGVIPSDSTGVNTNTLTLINLQPEDVGNYRCVATNASGSSESNYAAITINGTYKYFTCIILALRINVLQYNRFVFRH